MTHTTDPSADGPGGRRRAAIVAAVVLAALGVRLAYALAVAPRPYRDTDRYERIALLLIERGEYATEPGHPTAFRPCLYPLFLAGLYRVVGPSHAAVGVAQSLLGAAAVWLTVIAGARVLGWRGGVIAGAMLALSPLHVQSAGLLMTEDLFALIFAGLVALLAGTDRQPSLRTAVWVGLLGGLGALCRPTMLACVALLLAAMAATMYGRAWRRCLFVGVAAAVAALCLVPWAVRNRRALGSPIFMTTHGGYTLLLGNNPRFHFRVTEGRAECGGVWPEADLRDWQAGLAAMTRGMTETESDRFLFRRALAFIRESPGGFARRCLIKAGRVWRPIPHGVYGTAVRLGSGVFYGVVFVLAVVGLIRLRRRLHVILPWLALCVALTGVHAVFWANIRMRAPLEPILAILAAAAVTWRRRTARGSQSRGVPGSRSPVGPALPKPQPDAENDQDPA